MRTSPSNEPSSPTFILAVLFPSDLSGPDNGVSTQSGCFGSVINDCSPSSCQREHSERDVGITRIKEFPILTDLNCDIHRIDEVIVGHALIEKQVTAIWSHHDARIKTRSIRERREELIDVSAIAHAAFQRVAGILVFFDFRQLVRSQAGCVETDVLDLRATEVKQPLQLLIIGLGVSNK